MLLLFVAVVEYLFVPRLCICTQHINICDHTFLKFIIVIGLVLKHTQEDSLQQSDVCSETTLDQNWYLND